METRDEKIRYSSFRFLLSSPKLVKTVFHCSLHSKQNHEFTHVYPSLWTESISSSCTFDFDQYPSFEPHDIKDHPCEPHETTVDNTSIPHSSVSSNIPNRYIPLHLPLILHDFPTKHYNYLPKFDQESKNITAEKHLQAFEHFLDLFEVEHDDVYMRFFSQYLQGDFNEWFKHLHLESISTWEEFSDIFLNFWGERRPLDQIISEFYSLKKQEDETMSSFNRRFARFYFNMPKEI